ncbi:MAG: S-methyl-5-thioribose-1-phosphate isomerase [Lachnospiraceae bacterium]|jgi:methylthioribose-1-phosphate isomerase|nr:S-methyl-5-thioribose-1-phosphate isomerase [Lachnospiraceae bacterium]
MNIQDIDTVSLSDDEEKIVIIDQTLLPNEIKLKEINKLDEMEQAIKKLEVRGAPAIGVFAALSVYVLALGRKNDPRIAENLISEIKDLNATRPTAVNLSWALSQMKQITVNWAIDNKIAEPDGTDIAIKQESTVSQNEILIGLLKEKSIGIRDEDIDVCRRLGENGLELIEDGYGILTHCNAGKLATVRYGTATAPMYLAHEKGYNIKVYCDETRPLLQGARLTAFELAASGIDTTLQCDNMSGSLMREGKINAIFTGCDRVAANGDAANKIGTSMVATLAKRYKIPFYIVSPTSTIDMNTKTGEDIVIEQRNPDEVTELWYDKRMAPENIHIYNPAFDVTDNDLISGIVTEYGIARPPYTESLRTIMDNKKHKI